MTAHRAAAIARQIAMTVALASGVTVAGVAAGALLIAPAVSKVAGTDGAATSFHLPAVRLPVVHMPSVPTVWLPTLSMPTLPALAQFTSPRTRALLARFAVPMLLTALSLLALSRLSSIRQLFARRPSTTFAPTSARNRMRTPVRPDRTPRAVEALAASGTAPSEISWRTGLPLDAVALLLSLATAQRQLQPPSA